MKTFALTALLLCSACSDPDHSPSIDTGLDGPGSGGEGLGTGGESSPGSGGMAALGGSGGASGGVAAVSGGATGAAGSVGFAVGASCGDGTAGPCVAGSTCYGGRCTKACTTDLECGAGERCGEMYKGERLTEANRPPLGCLKPCHIPGVAPDTSGCEGENYCEFYIGSRIVGADGGEWLPMPDPCVGGAHFCAAVSALVEDRHLCTEHIP